MSAKSVARKIIKEWMEKPGATVELDLFIPIVAALVEQRKRTLQEVVNVMEDSQDGDWDFLKFQLEIMIEGHK